MVHLRHRQAQRVFTAVFLALSTALSVLLGAGVSPAAPRALHPGDARFWEGSAEGATTSFDVKVAGRAHRLRVAVDHPGTTDAFSVRLRAPSGRVVATAREEAFAVDPKPGVWRVDVLRDDPEATEFRLRAKLEKTPRPRPGVPLRPNLRAEPGYDFGFSYVEAACGIVGESCSGIAPAPLPPFCAADETAEDRAVRCLRFSFGYQNAGDGPLDLRFGTLDPVTRSVAVRQRIFLGDATPYDYTDNRYSERDAATATYHEVHGHFHYDNIFGARLFKVLDEETGEVEPVADVAKRGACAHDIAFVGFERFFQDPQHLADSGTDCNFTFTNPTSPAVRIGLSAGWGDIYTAGLSDNYVDFGLNTDGLYLLEVKADVDDTIEETNERDNYGYSLIEIEGLSVELIERGRGRSPWDPHKVVVHGLGD